MKVSKKILRRLDARHKGYRELVDAAKRLKAGAERAYTCPGSRNPGKRK